MTEHQSSRTLVKSAPELWAECSDAASLARHLGAFGEIRITKLEPETAVAWEGAAASGTVRLESSGWGTRVTLTVKEDPAPPAEPEPATEEPEAVEPEAAEPEAIELEPEPEAMEPQPVEIAVDPARAPGMFARVRLAFRRRPAPVIEPDVGEPEVVEPEPVATELEPDPVAETPPELEPVAEASRQPEPESPRPTGEDALVAALDSLGMAHHRPYSRA
jgi:hypothetical protein